MLKRILLKTDQEYCAAKKSFDSFLTNESKSVTIKIQKFQSRQKLIEIKGIFSFEKGYIMSEELKATSSEEMEDYTPDLMTLEDEEGNEHTFEVIDATDFNSQRYMAVVPYVEDPSKIEQEDMELIIMKVAEDEQGEYLDIVDDDNELYEVSEMFAQRLKDLYDIEN